MSDFLKKLKGIFVVDVPASDGNAPPVPSKTEATQPQKNTPNVAPTAVPTGKVTDQFYDILLGSMEQNNQEGFDYLEYKKSLQTLAKMSMDEQTRYFSAYAAAQAMGITAEKLVNSAQFYSNVLKKEEEKFQIAHQAQREKQIGGKEKAITDLEATIKAKGEQIARLTEEIRIHQEEMGKMKDEISESVIKIETTMNDFQTTYHDLLSQIEKDIENMKKYLK
jgi:hypothetical protein